MLNNCGIDYEQLDINKWKLFVPLGVRFIAQWNEFNLNLFSGPFIIDKQIPGCGFTEFCLSEKSGNIILCSPRRILLENKQDQHPDEVHYAKNGLDVDPNVDTEVKKEKGGKKDLEVIREGDPIIAKQQMFFELDRYLEQRGKLHKPLKIIVTYDSFKHVKEFFELKGIFGHFTIVVDEFQSIFIDARFKPSTEMSFFNILKTVKNRVCFVSATPMIEKYLFQLPEFKNMPYFEFDWKEKDNTRVMTPLLKIRKVKSIISEMKAIIGTYLEGKFAVLPNSAGQAVQSKEAVFYLNSVNDIFKVIKGMNLTPEQCNILCSDTIQNRNKLKTKLGVKYQIGRVPTKGEPHKMFTFCTRTVYLGADFYSTCARTFVLSDANIDSLSVDISLDLPQILGRQRLLANPWKNHAEFYYKPLGLTNGLNKQVFDKYINDKINSTNIMIGAYEKMTDLEKGPQLRLLKQNINTAKYSEDYISIDTVNGIPTPTFNHLIKISEERAFDIQQVDYKSRFTVFNAIKKTNGVGLDQLSEFIDHLRSTDTPISSRLKELCENNTFTLNEKKMIAQQVSEKFDQYYNLVGPDRCKALGYNITYIKQEVENKRVSTDKLREAFLDYFRVGDKIARSKVKELTSTLYQELGLEKKAKATDLSEYFETKSIKTKTEDGSWVNSIEILSVKKGGNV